MVQRDVCTNYFSTLTQEYKVVMIKEKITKILRCSEFKSGASKVWFHFLQSDILPRVAKINIVLHNNLL